MSSARGKSAATSFRHSSSARCATASRQLQHVCVKTTSVDAAQKSATRPRSSTSSSCQCSQVVRARRSSRGAPRTRHDAEEPHARTLRLSATGPPRAPAAALSSTPGCQARRVWAIITSHTCTFTLSQSSRQSVGKVPTPHRPETDPTAAITFSSHHDHLKCFLAYWGLTGPSVCSHSLTLRPALYTDNRTSVSVYISALMIVYTTTGHLSNMPCVSLR
jgi:hypothetical protein